MRMLEARLRKVSIYWLREPNWNQIAHDIAINDFRMQVQKAVSKLPSITMEPWQTEGTFRRDMDIISYEFENRSGQKEKMNMVSTGMVFLHWSIIYDKSIINLPKQGFWWNTITALILYIASANKRHYRG